MNRKFLCFVIGVPQIFKELDSVPRFKKGWEPLGYRDAGACFRVRLLGRRGKLLLGVAVEVKGEGP